MVAFAFARRHPEQVERLVLIDLAVPGLGLEEAMDVAHGGLWHFGFFHTPDVPEMLLTGHEQEFFPWWYHQLSQQPVDPDALADAVRPASPNVRACVMQGSGHFVPEETPTSLFQELRTFLE